jgi:segregation and condensation protein B
MNLVKIVGRAEDLGRPLLYGTARRFLEVFGLPSLEDLPQVEALAARAPAQTAPEDDTAAAETNEPPIAPDDASETADARDDADARPPEADDGPHLALAEAPDDEPLDASDGPNDESSSSERQAADPIE